MDKQQKVVKKMQESGFRFDGIYNEETGELVFLSKKARTGNYYAIVEPNGDVNGVPFEEYITILEV